MFKIGNRYTRAEIHNTLGGSMQSCLPTRNGSVVCGCFIKGRLNPGAPHRVLAGTGKIIESSARVFASQKEPVPVFIKHRVNESEYVGDFRVASLSQDPSLISREQQLTGRHDITIVLDLVNV
ncbi:MAG: hypothetical protein ABSC05_36430 [Candidatus Solibacter sp.]|jgi:hypothetical protein